MAIKRSGNRKPSIDLDGPAGNVFALMGNARVIARRLGFDADAILEEMKAGDYTHAVLTFNKHFGDYIDLHTQDKRLLAAGKGA